MGMLDAPQQPLLIHSFIHTCISRHIISMTVPDSHPLFSVPEVSVVLLGIYFPLDQCWLAVFIYQRLICMHTVDTALDPVFQLKRIFKQASFFSDVFLFCNHICFAQLSLHCLILTLCWSCPHQDTSINLSKVLKFTCMMIGVFPRLREHSTSSKDMEH